MTCSPFDSASLRGRILVIEAPSVFREMQSLVLRGAGYDVVNCDDVAAAELTLARQQFNAVVVNIDLPADQQPDFLLSLRRECPMTAVIVVTASANSDAARPLTRLGITAVMQRPVNPHTLTLKLDQVLGFSLPPGAPKLHADAPAGDPPTRIALGAEQLGDDPTAISTRHAQS